MATEAEVDRSGVRITREERRSLRTADFSKATPDFLASIKAKAELTVQYLKDSHARQLASGIPATDETLARNCATHLLTIECAVAALSLARPEANGGAA